MIKNHYFAHASSERAWETVGEHLEAVENEIVRNDSGLLGKGWAELAARWHDLGKFSDEFQTYLRFCSESPEQAKQLRGSVDHSSAGAQWACQQDPKIGRILAYIIAGHHGGLPDHPDLDRRLKKKIPDWKSAAPATLLQYPMPALPRFSKPDSPSHAAFRVMFWIRMLFSVLVDADFIATETYMSPEKSAIRSSSLIKLNSLHAILTAHLENLCATVKKTEVNQSRAAILKQCRQGAPLSPGFFSLCVPTGGGKTFASLAFALEHAVLHDLQRVIIAVPFTSIIEQNADEYQKVFAPLGAGVMIEHHSNIDPDKETDQNRLQAENWDAPLIITTTVQLYESLFGNKTSRCRKLHRLAKSVIILDEVQSLPVEVLKPTLLALRELVETYGCTVVLCSATLPAVLKRAQFPIGLENVRPLIPDAVRLYESMRRTRVTDSGVLTDESLTTQVLEHEQALCIVNTRKAAARLAELIGGKTGHYHLSTQMCAAHRLQIINKIRNRLKEKQLCRVISTQLIEAGVNLDFPVVFRARCGLDSLAQAAGRCNREGKLIEGKVIFFAMEEPPPPGTLCHTAQITEELLPQVKDLLAPDSIEQYFRLYYWQHDNLWDARQIIKTAGNNPNSFCFQFETMAQRYRLIDEYKEPVLISWGETGEKLIEEFRTLLFPDRKFFRKLQRYVVSVHPETLKNLIANGWVEKIHERWVLVDSALYDDYLGLALDIDVKGRETVI